MSSQHGKRWPTNGGDRLVSFKHPSKFQRLSRLGFVTAPMSCNGDQPNFARCLAVSWAGTIFWGLLPPNGILPGAKFTLRPSLAFSYSPFNSELKRSTWLQLSAKPTAIILARTSECWCITPSSEDNWHPSACTNQTHNIHSSHNHFMIRLL